MTGRGLRRAGWISATIAGLCCVAPIIIASGAATGGVAVVLALFDDRAAIPLLAAALVLLFIGPKPPLEGCLMVRDLSAEPAQDLMLRARVHASRKGLMSDRALDHDPHQSCFSGGSPLRCLDNTWRG